MSVQELTDQQIISMLPNTCPAMTVIVSGTRDKKSREYRSAFSRINRHLKSMNKCGMIRWDKVVDDAKLWEVC